MILSRFFSIYFILAISALTNAHADSVSKICTILMGGNDHNAAILIKNIQNKDHLVFLIGESEAAEARLDLEAAARKSATEMPLQNLAQKIEEISKLTPLSRNQQFLKAGEVGIWSKQDYLNIYKKVYIERGGAAIEGVDFRIEPPSNGFPFKVARWSSSNEVTANEIQNRLQETPVADNLLIIVGKQNVQDMKQQLIERGFTIASPVTPNRSSTTEPASRDSRGAQARGNLKRLRP